MKKRLKKNDVSDARYLLEALTEYTDDPQADWYREQLEDFINRVESELFPQDYSRKMDRLRDRMDSIRNQLEESHAATNTEGRGQHRREA